MKNMNQMMLYSKCVTIRDAQIEEKKHMMLEAEEESRRLDLMMEIERLKALENYEVGSFLQHFQFCRNELASSSLLDFMSILLYSHVAWLHL